MLSVFSSSSPKGVLVFVFCYCGLSYYSILLTLRHLCTPVYFAQTEIRAHSPQLPLSSCSSPLRPASGMWWCHGVGEVYPAFNPCRHPSKQTAPGIILPSSKNLLKIIRQWPQKNLWIKLIIHTYRYLPQNDNAVFSHSSVCTVLPPSTSSLSVQFIRLELWWVLFIKQSQCVLPCICQWLLLLPISLIL